MATDFKEGHTNISFLRSNEALSIKEKEKFELVQDQVPRPRVVVRVDNAWKKYRGNNNQILQGYSMTVQEGTIYSLLGASGCGKTTALTSILGLRSVDSGNIFVFGLPPRSFGLNENVGYMPQEISLHGDFCIGETIKYYGVLYGMSKNAIEKRLDFLTSFLDLPDCERRVNTLSSGQQRRVSLGVALIHSPKLLILDEPTVGLDSILREKIWAHLHKLVNENGVTAIITTHYVEEARRSDTVGIMRGGKLLAEKNPKTLMKEHGTALLADVVFKLSIKQNEADEEKLEICNESYTKFPESSNGNITKRDEKEQETSYGGRRRASFSTLTLDMEKESHWLRQSVNRVQALILKNVFTMMRNIFLVLFMILTPSLMTILICNGLGNDPKPLTIGVVNPEGNATTCQQFGEWKLTEEDGCDLEYLSCKFLQERPKDVIVLREYESQETARAGVENGEVWGYIKFPANFSEDIYAKMAIGARADEETLQGSVVLYQLDMTNRPVSSFLKKSLFDTYEAFIKKLLRNCGLNEALGESPVKALTPVYGNDDTDFREFTAVSLLVGFMFFFPLCSSSAQFLYEKQLGTLERARVAGVRTGEILLSYLITEGLVVILQVVLSIAIIWGLFGIGVKGSVGLVALQYGLSGICGLSAGFLFASILSKEVEAVFLAIATFFPNFLLSGMVWPLEGMPLLMQYGAYLLPCTFPAEAARSIWSRGWGIGHGKVWPGFVGMGIWLIILWGLTIFVHKVMLRRK